MFISVVSLIIVLFQGQLIIILQIRADRTTISKRKDKIAWRRNGTITTKVNTFKYIVVTHEQIHYCHTRTNTLLSHTNKYIFVTHEQIHCCHTGSNSLLSHKIWNQVVTKTLERIVEQGFKTNVYNCIPTCQITI
jgi:hypothetical protein